jgi:hypothetical protein
MPLFRRIRAEGEPTTSWFRLGGRAARQRNVVATSESATAPTTPQEPVVNVEAAVEAAAEAELWAELERLIDTDPRFGLVTFDGLEWIDPFTGVSIPAPFDLRPVILRHYREQHHWRSGALLDLAGLLALRWRHWLLANLQREARFRRYDRQHRWINPFDGQAIPGVPFLDGPERLDEVVDILAEILAQIPDADPRELERRRQTPSADGDQKLGIIRRDADITATSLYVHEVMVNKDTVRRVAPQGAMQAAGNDQPSSVTPTPAPGDQLLPTLEETFRLERSHDESPLAIVTDDEAPVSAQVHVSLRRSDDYAAAAAAVRTPTANTSVHPHLELLREQGLAAVQPAHVWPLPGPADTQAPLPLTLREALAARLGRWRWDSAEHEQTSLGTDPCLPTLLPPGLLVRPDVGIGCSLDDDLQVDVDERPLNDPNWQHHVFAPLHFPPAYRSSAVHLPAPHGHSDLIHAVNLADGGTLVLLGHVDQSALSPAEARYAAVATLAHAVAAAPQGGLEAWLSGWHRGLGRLRRGGLGVAATVVHLPRSADDSIHLAIGGMPRPILHRPRRSHLLVKVGERGAVLGTGSGHLPVTVLPMRPGQSLLIASPGLVAQAGGVLLERWQRWQAGISAARLLDGMGELGNRQDASLLMIHRG